MNPFSLVFMRIFNRRLSRPGAKSADHAASTEAASPELKYTLVDPILGGRKLNMLNGGHIDGKMLDQSRSETKSCKARWLKNRTEQAYIPRKVKLDPQLEFYYENLGLNRNAEQTNLGGNP